MNKVRFGFMLATLALVSLVAYAQAPFKLTSGTGAEIHLAAFGVNGIIYDSGIQTISTGGTTLTTTKTWVQAIHCNTINSVAATLTIQDGSSNVYFDHVPLTANQTIVDQYGPVGIPFVGGIKITAGTGSALNCQIEGVQ